MSEVRTPVSADSLKFALHPWIFKVFGEYMFELKRHSGKSSHDRGVPPLLAEQGCSALC